MERSEWLKVDPEAGRPPFEQLRTQIIDGVRDGRLTAGMRLPTVRELAGQLGLAVNTVARSYRELESAGIVETRGRSGTFVASIDASGAAMAAAAQTYAGVVRSLGLTKSDAVRYLEAAFG
ncbi:MAG: GntR family transcriptional regulator [Mycobacterium sp.]